MLTGLRRLYRPKIPSLLESLNSLSLKKGVTLPVKKEIQKLFPKTSSYPLLHVEKGLSFVQPPLKVAVIFSGGPAPGGHNVIAGVFDALKQLNRDSHLIGFLDGPQGMITGTYTNITIEKVDHYRNQSGFDLLGTGRKKIETKEELKLVLNTFSGLGLDGIIIIGGDDSNTNAAIIAEYLLSQKSPITVIGVPKTIDGDLQNQYVSIPFGFDTATKVYAELIGNLAKDVLSSKKNYHFIKLMGRSASHVTLECSLKTHPNLTLITEERKSFAQIIREISDLVDQRAILGKNFGLILIPEGIAETGMGDSLGIKRDSHGNVIVSDIDIEQQLIKAVSVELKKRDKPFYPLPHFFGYEGRSAFPTNFDANYGYALGQTAALLTALRVTSYMTFVNHLTEAPSAWGIGGVPLTSQMELVERSGIIKPVIKKTFVDIKGKRYRSFKESAVRWALEDEYQEVGPIQFFGSAELTDGFPLILYPADASVYTEIS